MYKKRTSAVVLLFSVTLLFFLSCSDEDKDLRDMEKPAIDMNYSDASPENCVSYYRGESIPVRALFSDNQELGSFNIEIHHNFDHHSHSTDNVECELDPKKEPILPFVYNQDFPIPIGSTTYEANITISIPADVDTGDYHFMIRVTDKAGWQQLKAISLKIKERS